LQLVEELGAVPIDHSSKGYREEVREAGGEQGFDLILEMLANQNLALDLELLAPRGRVVIIGSRGPIEIDPRATMGKETEIRGLAVFNSTAEETVATHDGLARAIESGDLTPRVSVELPLEKAPEAHRLVMENGNCGKIVLQP
jgi:NADPH2:quinone reductase